MNVCYGEKIELQLWISNSIAPLCIIQLVLYISLYFSADSISKPAIKYISILLVIMILFYFGIGIYAIASAAATQLTDIQTSWDILSYQSKVFYYDNDIKVLFSTFNAKMMATAILYLLLAVLTLILVCFSYQYYERLTND